MQEELAINNRRKHAQQKMNERIRELYRAQQMQIRKDQIIKEEQSRIIRMQREMEFEERRRRLEERRHQQQSILKKKKEEELQLQMEQEKEKAIRSQMSKIAIQEWHRQKREQERRKYIAIKSGVVNRYSSNQSVAGRNEVKGTPKSDVSKVVEEAAIGSSKLVLQSKKQSLSHKYQTVYATPNKIAMINQQVTEAVREKYTQLHQEHIKRKMNQLKKI